MPADPRSATTIFCFEDRSVDRLNPATTARPAYAISCASLRLIDHLEALRVPIFGECRPHLAEVQRLDFGLTEPPASPERGPATLLVNARVVPNLNNVALLERMLRDRQPAVVRDSEGKVAMAWLPPGHPSRECDPGDSGLAGEGRMGGPSGDQDTRLGIDEWAERVTVELPAVTELADTFQWPHDIVLHHMRSMSAAMEWRIAGGDYEQIADGVFVAPGAKIGDHAVIDVSKGPILIERDAQVGPFCFLAGPVHIGAGARILEHAALKDAVALGHTTKVGGEVEASVIEPFTNKQHHGFLGHSYLGSWINLGAGTCNSDLKNTYGTINMEYGAEKVATEMQFMGCVMGDYSKTAINTGIFTGKVVGVCSMLYGFVTSNVPSFVNYARLFGQTATLPPEVMISTQARMFSRRRVTQRPCDQQLIFDMFELTEEERNLQSSIGL